MTDFRVTQSMLSSGAVLSLQDNLSRIQRYQEELSSGQAVNRPSDNPTDAAAAMQYRADIRRTQQYQTNAADGLAWLGTADSTLTGIVDAARQARDLTLQGANGTLTAQERSNIADQVDSIRQSLLASANTQYLGRPIFGGTTAGTNAYDTTTGAYVGDAGAVVRTVAPDTAVKVNLTGPAVFGPAGSSLFDVLSQVSADLRNPAATSSLTSTDIANLDNSVQNVTGALADVGARYNRIQSLKTSAQTNEQTLTNGLSTVEDTDLPKTIMDLQLQQSTYQAALAVTAKIIQPSLVDFLR